MISDRVGDFIIRLKNAGAVGKPSVLAPYSKHLESIAKKLRELGFVTAVSSEEGSASGGAKKILKVSLAYDERGNSRIRGVSRISKPGRRLYASHRFVHSVKNGTGARILSTPKGILSDAEARRERTGGEEMFKIW